MRINNNLSALSATNGMAKTELKMNKSIERLSSGLRVNRAADDAAGLAISEKMRAQISSLEAVKRNLQDGISLVQTAEGAMDEVNAILNRMRELAVQAANGIYTTVDKGNIKLEGDELILQLEEIAQKANFNGINLLNDDANTINIQAGINKDDVIAIKGVDITTDTLNLTNLDITTVDSIEVIDEAINVVVGYRAVLGASQNRMEHTMNSVVNAHENLTASESRIRDVDMATEMAEFSKNQALLQAGVSIASQANQKNQMIMNLLQ